MVSPSIFAVVFVRAIILSLLDEAEELCDIFERAIGVAVNCLPLPVLMRVCAIADVR